MEGQQIYYVVELIEGNIGNGEFCSVYKEVNIPLLNLPFFWVEIFKNQSIDNRKKTYPGRKHKRNSIHLSNRSS